MNWQSKLNNVAKKWFGASSPRKPLSKRHPMNVELLEDRVVPTTYSWIPTAAGTFDWNNSANWSVVSGPGTTFPSVQGDVALVQSALAGDETINLNQGIIVGTLDIGASSGTNAFTIAPNGGSLSLSVSSGSANVAKTTGGADQITAPLTFSSNVIFDNSLTAPNTLSIANTTSGNKTVTINSPSTNTGEVDFAASAALSGAGNITVSAGTLGINTITLTSSRTISIAAGASVNSSGTINTTANGSSTYSAVTGSGTLNLTSTTNSPSSPDISFNSNELSNTNANYGTRITSNVNLGAGQRYIWGESNHNGVGPYGTNADCVMNGAISGNGGITFIAQATYTGPGGAMEVPLYLASANTFNGPVVITRGSIYLGSATSLNGNDVSFNPTSGNNARLFLFGHDASIGNLTSSGAGTSVIANNPGSVTTAAATLTVNQTSEGTFAGPILQTQFEYYTSGGTSGAISVVKMGSAKLTLSGASTYVGATTVNAGALSVGADANLGDASFATTGNIVLNGGTLLASSSFTLNSSRGITLGDPSTPNTGGEIDVAAGATLTYAGVIADDTGGTDSLTVGSGSNTGTLVLGGVNTFTGTTTVAAGTLAGNGTIGAVADNATINPGASTGANILNTGNLSFGTGGALLFDLNGTGAAGVNYDQLNLSGTINLTGATLNLSVNYSPTIGDTFTIIHNVSGAPITTNFNGLTQNGYFVASGHLFQIDYQGNGNNDVVITAVASPIYYAEADGWGGSYSIGQTIANPDPENPGADPAVFGGGAAVPGSGYKAFTSVNAALAQAAADGAVGATIVINGGAFAEHVSVTQNVTLDLQFADSTFNSLDVSATNASIALNGITLTTGDNTLASTAVLSAISGNGNLIKAGTDTMTLSGIDTAFTGTTEVSGGVLRLGSGTALGTTAAVQVDASGDLQLAGNSVNFGSLAGQGIIENASAIPTTLSLPASGTFDGTLQDGTGGGALSVTATGFGTFTLSGTSSTYTGAISISNGVLAVGSLGGAAAGSLVIDGGTLEYTTVGSTVISNRSLTIGAGGATINVDDVGSTVTFTGIVNGGTNTLTTGGAGEVSFSTANALTTGNITVNSGTLGINTITLSKNRTITINSGANVNSFGTINLTADGSLHPNVQVYGPGTLNLTSTTNNSGSPDIYFDFNDVNDNANWGTGISADINLGSSQRYFWAKDNHDSYGSYGTGADAYMDGDISGSGGISFIAQNSYSNGEASQTDFVLAGANTFTGEVEITRGAVYLANPSALTGNNVLVFDPIAGQNAWFYLYGNNTTVSDLQSSGAGASIIANSPGNSVGPATLTIIEDSTTFAGTIQDIQSDYAPGGSVGPLSIAVTGAGTLTLTGTNTYTGTTTLYGGVLTVASDANLGTDPSSPTAGNIVLDGGTLLASGSFTLNTNRGIAVGDPSTPGAGGEIDAAAGATLTYNGIIADNTGGPGNLTVGSGANTGTLILNGVNILTGTTAVNAGTLAGTGTFAAVANDAVIAPGATPGAAGIISTGDLSFGTDGSLTFEVNGAGSAGANYDQLNVTGAIDLTNADLNLTVNYAPAIGDSFTVIRNVDGAAITGNFNSLPDGATFLRSGHLFQISYEGNGSNDVVVTAVPVPVYYVEADAWLSQGVFVVGQTIPDADPVAGGDQNAVFGGSTAVVGSGYNAFTTVAAALTQAADDGAVGAIIVINGGTYNENVAVNQPVTLDLQYADSTFTSLAGSDINSGVELSGVTLTTGDNNHNTTLLTTISGTGNLIKSGTDTMTLSGNNTAFTGTTEVSNGVLRLGSATGLGANSTVQVDAAGDLQLGGNSVTVAGLTGSGIVENADAAAATLTVATPTTDMFSGVLQDGSGGGKLSLTASGPGTFMLLGSNSTYTGATTVSNSALAITTLADGGAASSIGASSNDASNLVIDGGTLEYFAAGSTVSTDRSLTIGAGGATIDVTDAGSTVTFTGIVSGATNALTVNSAGAGTLIFSTANALTTGNITVSAGTLGINSITLSQDTILSIAAGANVNSFGTINLIADPGDSRVEVVGPGMLNLTSTTNNASTPDIYFNPNDVNDNTNWGTSISADINLGSSQRYFFGKDNHDSYGEYGSSADAYISGAISGSGGISFIAQNSYQDAEASQTDVVLAGANTFTGEVEITRGAVYLANPDALTGNNAVVFDPIAGQNAWFYLYGNSTTVSNLQSSGDGTSIIANSPGNTVGEATLTIEEDTDTTYAGTIRQIKSDYNPGGSVGSLSITKTGAGTLALTGANSYSGTTTVNDGALSVTDNANLGADPGFALAGNVVLNGGTLLASGSFTLSSNRGIAVGDTSTPSTGGEIDVAAGATLTYGGVIADNSGGSDSLTVGSDLNTGTLILSGANTYTGGTIVNAGTLEVDGSIQDVTVASDATLDGTGTVGTTTVNGTIHGGTDATTGTLTTDLSFGASGIFAARLDSDVNYDQVVVAAGTVDLTNATLNLVLGASFSGASFDILVNNTGSAITGNFTYNGAILTEGSTLTVGSQQFTITYMGGGTGQDVVLTANAGVAPTFESIEVNGGTPQYADAFGNGSAEPLAGQNSVVEQILVTFNEPVTLDPGAFSVTPFAISADGLTHPGQVLVNSGPNPNQVAPILNAPIQVGDGHQWIITFGNNAATTPNGSGFYVLKDGVYSLNIDHTKVTANSQNMAADVGGPGASSFWVLYGDTTFHDISGVDHPGYIGDGYSDASVGNADFQAFKACYNSDSTNYYAPPNYNVKFDANLDGSIANSDFVQFKTNYNTDWQF
jgi:fibronectin-binding autotransporter adhesin